LSALSWVAPDGFAQAVRGFKLVSLVRRPSLEAFPNLIANRLRTGLSAHSQ